VLGFHFLTPDLRLSVHYACHSSTHHSEAATANLMMSDALPTAAAAAAAAGLGIQRTALVSGH